MPLVVSRVASKPPRCEPDDPDAHDAPAGRASIERLALRQPSGRAKRGKGTFRQRDVYAAIRAIEKAGKHVSHVEMNGSGTIKFVLGDATTEESGVNEWDVVFK